MKPQPDELVGKTILVTGAAKRIGRGIALRLAREGARVAIHYSRSEKEARQTAEECGGAELFRANLESVPEIERMFQEVGERLGRAHEPHGRIYGLDRPATSASPPVGGSSRSSKRRRNAGRFRFRPDHPAGGCTTADC